MLKAVTASDFKPMSRFSRFLEQGRNYTTLVAWLVHTVFSGRMRLLSMSIVLNLVHLACQAAAIFIIYWYAKQMEGGGVASIPYLDLSLNLRDYPQLLWAVVLASCLCFVLSATLLFFSRKLVFDIVEAQYAHSLERLILDGSQLPDPRARLASRIVTNFGIGGLSTGARRGALIASSVANAIAAVIGALGASIFLIRVDLPLTLMIVVSVGLVTLFLYPLTLRAVKNATATEKAQLAYKTEARDFFEKRNADPPPQHIETAPTLARVFLMRRRVLTEIVLAIEIGVTVILGVVVFYMASQALAGREEWAIFIAYVGALRIALGGATAAIQVFAGVSRFYPRVMRYHLFMRDVSKMNNVALAKLQPGDTVILGALQNGTEVVTKVGQRVALVTTDPIQRVLYALIDAQSPQSPLPIGVTVVDSVGISAKDGAIALVYLSRLEDVGAKLDSLAGALKDKVVLVTYTDIEKIGSCGEEDLLTIAGNEMRRFVRLGTPEADAAIKEIAMLAKKLRAYEEEDDEAE
jgi:hypothetical protein